MADKKEFSKSGGGGEPLKLTFEGFLADSFVLIFGLFLLAALLSRIALIFGGDGQSGVISFFHLSGFISWFENSLYPVVRVISAVLSLVFLWGIIYAFRKLSKIAKERAAKYEIPAVLEKIESGEVVMPATSKKLDYKKKWHQVLSHASSNNQNDWKIAILDADAILDDVLIAKGYMGDTMGDRMKSIDRADLKTLDLAWEAHKYRNKLAHGDEVEFNQHEVRRIISHFEKVLKEFKAI